VPEDPKREPTKTAEPEGEPSSPQPAAASAPPAPASPTETSDRQDESEIGDFITRHVLEKDSVFFEG